MLSEKDKEFIIYWERVRERQNTFPAKLLAGLPMAVLFCIPILLLVTVVYLFLPEWYTRISNTISGSMTTIVIAMVICMFFFAYFRMQFKWESNEQHYQELKSKESKNN